MRRRLLLSADGFGISFSHERRSHHISGIFIFLVVTGLLFHGH